MEVGEPAGALGGDALGADGAQHAAPGDALGLAAVGDARLAELHP